MDRFIFFVKRSFRYENDDEKTKNETILFNNNIYFFKSFVKTVVFKLIGFIKFVVRLTIVNDDPSLSIVNEEWRREEPDAKGFRA